MVDIFDRAAEQEQKQRELALAKQLEITQREQLSYGSIDCVECGDPIPFLRKKLFSHATRCVECQEILERRR